MPTDSRAQAETTLPPFQECRDTHTDYTEVKPILTYMYLLKAADRWVRVCLWDHQP